MTARARKAKPAPAPAETVRDASVVRAAEQAVAWAEEGLTPRDCIERVGTPWTGKTEPKWDDAVFVLAMAWRRHCSGDPKSAFEEVARTPPTAMPTVESVQTGKVAPPPPATSPEPLTARVARGEARRLRACMHCRREFLSEGPHNRLCRRDACVDARAAKSSSLA